MKNLKLLRPTLYNYIATEEEFNHYTTKLFNLLATGQLKTFLQKVYPLEEIQQVHRVRTSLGLSCFSTVHQSLNLFCARRIWKGEGRREKFLSSPEKRDFF